MVYESSRLPLRLNSHGDGANTGGEAIKWSSGEGTCRASGGLDQQGAQRRERMRVRLINNKILDGRPKTAEAAARWGSARHGVAVVIVNWVGTTDVERS